MLTFLKHLSLLERLANLEHIFIPEFDSSMKYLLLVQLNRFSNALNEFFKFIDD